MALNCIILINGGFVGSHLRFDVKFWAAPKLISKGMGSG